ncbi:hypothetical protein [Chryseobacterium sp. YIM B08800]|uniref:hypothetical protein n=1 Tax=Chryseobacterium sp. YIM B08800 TaxID=2984136 RepID=UPI002240AC49|nr:hypothetical protein [Chryseobacterium sp. YIM B08800]
MVVAIPKKKSETFEQTSKPVVIKTNEMDSVKNISKDTIPDFDSNKYAIDEKDIKPPIPIPPKIVVVKIPYIEPIKCFNPNLTINDAVELINSRIMDTQWFIVEDKKVNYQHIKLDQTDTIWMKEKLLKMDWKLIDSSQTNIGNQNRITLKMQKENRICNIKKELYLAGKEYDNVINEWFEIRAIKVKPNEEN